MTNEQKIIKVKQFMKENMGHEYEMHDYLHAFRVLKNANLILEKEKANSLIVQTASLVHDFIDYKLFDNPDIQEEKIKSLLKELEYTEKDIEEIIYIINNISYSSGKVPNTIEGKIVQDADRLDAMGAIGVLRPFTYGAVTNRVAYDNESSSLSHFLEKKPKLKKLLNTETARKIADKREEIMYIFLKQLLSELDDDIYERNKYQNELKELGVI